MERWSANSRLMHFNKSEAASALNTSTDGGAHGTGCLAALFAFTANHECVYGKPMKMTCRPDRVMVAKTLA
jgi:hypothetical protein